MEDMEVNWLKCGTDIAQLHLCASAIGTPNGRVEPEQKPFLMGDELQMSQTFEGT